ncbi:MAG: non-canonical purine NTP pyrophosphatase [Candidatus Pacebacteria bacterium]|nr:non-canonical purine NTP pyrophosphatase [Candidatus Paceibacterota bacterium]
MKELIYATGNPLKFAFAQKALEGAGITIFQKDLDIPEIQSKNVEEIASFSAKWGSGLLKKPLIVSDAGYYIEALGGFPGPFIKFINQWLAAEDILKLMDRKENRSVLVKEALAYCEPDGTPVCFLGNFKGTIARSVGKKGITAINEIFIPDGFARPESEISSEDRALFWSDDSAWRQMVEHLKSLGNDYQ